MPDAQRRDVVSVDDEAITINVGEEYCVYLDQCDTPVKILAWVHHLGEKNWMTREIMSRFVEIAANRIGLDLVPPHKRAG